jgi:hypothetical protein
VAGVQHLWVRRVTCDYFFVFVSLEWPRQLVSTKTPRHTPNGIPTHSGVAAWNEAAANGLAFTVTRQHSLYVHKIKGKTRVAEQVEVLRGSSKKNDVWTLSQRFCFVVKANSKQTLKIKQ